MPFLRKKRCRYTLLLLSLEVCESACCACPEEKTLLDWQEAAETWECHAYDMEMPVLRADMFYEPKR